MSVLSSYSQKGYLDFKTISKGQDFTFPVFQSASDTRVSDKINTILQLFELQLLYQKNAANVFKEFQITSDSIMEGNTSLIFNIIENNTEVLSVSVAREWCGASCNHWTEYYNFNSGNGDLISLYDLIEKDKINVAMAVINWKRTFNFISQLSNLNSEQTIDTTSVLSEINNSILKYFYIKNDSVFISDEECLSKFEKIYYELNMISSFSADDLKPYLNNYGKAVLSNSKASVTKFNGRYFPQLYQGNTSDSALFYFTFDFFYDFNGSGFIAFKNNAVVHLFDGTLENDEFDLTEHDKDYTDIGFIKANIIKGKIIGTYKSFDGKINYSFSAERM